MNQYIIILVKVNMNHISSFSKKLIFIIFCIDSCSGLEYFADLPNLTYILKYFQRFSISCQAFNNHNFNVQTLYYIIRILLQFQ